MRLSVQLPFESYYLGATPPQIRMNTGFLLTFCTFPEQLMFNEYYARDTSRKIRSTFQSKGKSGKHLTGTVIYGYLWNEARDQWLVDPEAAEVVKRIFKQASRMLGLPPYYLRRLCKEVPGVAFQSGIKWYINLGKLVDYYNNSGRNAAG